MKACSILLMMGLFFSIQGLAESKLSASPPWVMSSRLLKETLGAEKCVQVSDAEEAKSGGYEVTVHVAAPCTRQKAQAIANILNTNRAMTRVIVTAPDGQRLASRAPRTPDKIGAALELALKGNPYFFSAATDEKEVTASFQPKRIRYSCDNINDREGMCEWAVNEAFCSIFKEEWPASVKVSCDEMPSIPDDVQNPRQLQPPGRTDFGSSQTQRQSRPSGDLPAAGGFNSSSGKKTVRPAQ